MFLFYINWKSKVFKYLSINCATEQYTIPQAKVEIRRIVFFINHFIFERIDFECTLLVLCNFNLCAREALSKLNFVKTKRQRTHFYFIFHSLWSILCIYFFTAATNYKILNNRNFFEKFRIYLSFQYQRNFYELDRFQFFSKIPRLDVCFYLI